MVVLSALVWLPRIVIGAFGVVMIVAHNGLDSVQPLLSEASPLLDASAHFRPSHDWHIGFFGYVSFDSMDWRDGARLCDRSILCGPQP